VLVLAADCAASLCVFVRSPCALFVLVDRAGALCLVVGGPGTLGVVIKHPCALIVGCTRISCGARVLGARRPFHVAIACVAHPSPGAFIYASVSGNPSLHYVDFMWIEDATGVSGPTLTLQVPYIGGGASICAIAGRGGLANSSQVCETNSYTNATWCSGT